VSALRHIVQGDGLAWLREHPAAPDTSVITSLPDASELPELSFLEWQAWFVESTRAVLRWVPQGSCAIFYQSDTRHDGAWVD